VVLFDDEDDVLDLRHDARAHAAMLSAGAHVPARAAVRIIGPEIRNARQRIADLAPRVRDSRVGRVAARTATHEENEKPSAHTLKLPQCDDLAHVM
jgi:hypothetical protein